MAKKPLKFGPGDQPFSTTNPLLAFCLTVAGVPFLNPAWPCINRYTADSLRAHGFKGKTDLLEAARECIKTGRQGKVIYRFKKTNRLGSLLKIFQEQCEEIDAPDKHISMADFQAGIVSQCIAGEIKYDEALIRLNCVTLKLRRKFIDMWREVPGEVVIDNEGETTREQNKIGEVFMVSPGAMAVTTNAKQETLRKLGLIS